MTEEEQADTLSDPKLGLVWLHATSFKEFIQDCIHCDEEFSGFTFDAASVAEDR